jgi:hypothetical protein
MKYVTPILALIRPCAHRRAKMKLIATCSVIVFLAGCESSKTSEKKPYRNTHTYDANGRYRNNDPRLYLGQSDL